MIEPIMLTEEEAKTKWCPMIRFSQHFNEIVNNRDVDGTSCLASGCMAWSWITEYAGLSHGGKQTNYRNTDKGFCGLVGKP